MSSSTPSTEPIKFSFGDSPELADHLLTLVLAGHKTATVGALRDIGADEPMPEVGRRDVVMTGSGEDACIIETVSVEIMAFDAIPSSFTDREGEGPYAEWRAGHEAYFARNGGFAPDMELVCETFRLVSILPAGEALLNSSTSLPITATPIDVR